jgi:hypothetical protein
MSSRKLNLDVDVNATFQRLRAACHGELAGFKFSGELPENSFLECIACVLKSGLTKEKVYLQKDDHTDGHYPSWKSELAFSRSHFKISINDFEFEGSPAQIFLDCDEPYLIFNADFVAAIIVHRNE